MRESDTERKSDAQLNNIFLTNPILRKNLSVLICPKSWETSEVSLVEKILRALEQLFKKGQIALREKFSFQWRNQGEM